MKKILLPVIILSLFSLISCNENINGIYEKPFITGYQLCYNKGGEIFTNDINGSIPVKIVSRASGAISEARWSPDGNNILYQPSGGVSIVYNINNGKKDTLNPDNLRSEFSPVWMRDGKILLSYQKFGEAGYSTYIISPDKSSVKKILPLHPKSLFFFNDNFTFIYQKDSLQLYKSNIDGTVNDYICLLDQRVQDFNPNTGEILETDENGVNLFNVNTLERKVVFTERPGYSVFQGKFSNDFTKIAIIEHSNYNEFLSIIENGKLKRLVYSPGNVYTETFSYLPVEFSADGNFIAFTKQVYDLDSYWFSWRDYLFAVNIKTSVVYLIDEYSFLPSWNPVIK